MKTIVLIVLLSGPLTVSAQTAAKSDSAFYFLDTAKTPVSDRLWHTYSESLVKFYELTVYSSCSPLLNKPTFGYSSKFQRPEIINEAKFKTIKKSSMSELLSQLKQFAEADRQTKAELKKAFYLYLIEPCSEGFTIVKTQLEGSGPRKISD